MGRKLGLVKDLGKTFGLGVVSGLIGNTIVATAASVGYDAIKEDREVDLGESLETGLKVGLGLSVVQGVMNTALQAGAIKENYEIRKLEDLRKESKDGIVILDDEGKVLERV